MKVTSGFHTCSRKCIFVFSSGDASKVADVEGKDETEAMEDETEEKAKEAQIIEEEVETPADDVIGQEGEVEVCEEVDEQETVALSEEGVDRKSVV